MSKTVKWLLGIALVLVTLTLIIKLCLSLFIDPNNYKETIAQKVHEQTGRTLVIPGDIDLDFSLIGLKTVFKMGQVNLSSSSDFPDTEFFASDHVEVNLALWPLIKDKELQINKILLDGVSVNLVINEEGVSNWDDLAGKKEPGQPAPEKQEPAHPPAEPEKGLAGIDIGGIQATHINLSYTDKQAKRWIKLSDLNLDIGHISQGQPFPFKADFALQVQQDEQQILSAEIKTKSDFTFSLADQHFAVDGFTLKGLINSSKIPRALDLEIAADIDLALQQQKLNIKNLTVREGDLNLQAMLSAVNLMDPQINGSIKLSPFSPRDRAKTFGIALPVEDPQALAKMSAELEFSGNLSELLLSKILLNLDETTVDGKASVANFLQPVFDLTLHVNQLDLDRYTAKKKAAQPTEEAQPADQTPQAVTAKPGEGGDQIILPVETLRGLNFNAAVTIDQLKVAKLNTTNIKLKATGKDGLIKLEPFAADFYDGTITLTADIDARPDTPELHFIEDLKAVQLGPMFLDMTGKEEVKGRADTHTDITTRGSTVNDLKKNANGTMNLSLADGEIAKLHIIDTVRTAKALLGNKSKDEAAEKQPAEKKAASGRSTAFASLTATGVITNGVFKNDDLLAESELMRVEGKGTVDIVNETIDYLLTIYLAKYLERDEKTDLVELSDTPIPYRINGTFDKIAQSAAVTELIKTEAKKVLFKELEKQLGGDEAKDGKGDAKESSDNTSDLINKGLKSLFGN